MIYNSLNLWPTQIQYDLIFNLINVSAKTPLPIKVTLYSGCTYNLKEHFLAVHLVSHLFEAK